MDVDTYSKVLRHKDSELYNDNNSEEGSIRTAEIAFKKDLIRKKVVWFNEQKKDWHAFLKNYHPLYSICTAPKRHPFSRAERLAVFINSMGFAACLSMFVSMITKGMATEDPDSDSDSEPATQTHIYIAHVELSIIAGFIKSVTNGILKCIAICACCQNNSCDNRFRCFCECIGHCLICLWSMFVLFLVIVFVAIAINDMFLRGFISSFIISNISGWIFSFCLLSICFKFKWKKEKANKNNELQKFKVSYRDYEKYQEEGRKNHNNDNKDTNDYDDNSQIDVVQLLESAGSNHVVPE